MLTRHARVHETQPNTNLTSESKSHTNIPSRSLEGDRVGNFLKFGRGKIASVQKIVILIPEEDNKRAERHQKSKLSHAWHEPFA